ncbi:hypothetical protein A2995_00665 [Candidatus Nomurabacteria bacterium RIFCSPLOWO2_01_FULL_33_24]|uniref:Uncharacterized protein n=1 Tax=Candidatus Nomurabacteria bacterium RIFCSPLOWO2_01_FULL_33_24 TaxID=1801765 RepID=A0A1F6X0W2_9BACT|nr:MAG: hypothetical protein A2995_00665 [Candidatus Nomurabacteria bacterium RIFCSPLOWO2_01_FULL_33_24]
MTNNFERTPSLNGKNEKEATVEKLKKELEGLSRQYKNFKRGMVFNLKEAIPLYPLLESFSDEDLNQDWRGKITSGVIGLAGANIIPGLFESCQTGVDMIKTYKEILDKKRELKQKENI